RDPQNAALGADIIVRAFVPHPVVEPLIGSGLYLIRPRAVSKLNPSTQAADAPRVQEIAFSGPKAFGADPSQPQRFPFIAAVEKGAIKGVITERGTTRMVIAGDSCFLANGPIRSAANRDFAGFALNWLLDRTQLLEGL